MTRVNIIKDWDREDDLLRQTPGNKGVWGDCQFTIGGTGECDAVVFTNRVRGDGSLICRYDGRLLLQMEPPTAAHRWYRRSDKYFDLVIGPDSKAPSRKRFLSHGALPWHINKSYDELQLLEPASNRKLVSMITSSANWMDGHELRLSLVEAASQGMLQFDLFGRGFEQVEDKYDALAPYKYSIVVENSFHKHYWTEKLADCLLSWTVPIYVGAPDILQYFPSDCLIVVPPKRSSIIKAVKALNVDDFEGRLPAIRQARQLILEEYQLFPFLDRIIRNQRLGAHDRFQFDANAAPWENGKIGVARKVEYQWRKFLKKKPY